MKSDVPWSKREPLLRPVMVLASLFIISSLLLAYQFKESIVDGVPRGPLFWANVVVAVVIGIAFQGAALYCNYRLRQISESPR
jgi:hypothetical protein